MLIKGRFFLLAALLFILGCASTKTFEFSLPEVQPYPDISIKYLESHDHINLAYREQGNKNSSYGILFVPGSTMYGYYYIPMMNAVSDNDVYIRVIDLRGHGDSGGIRGDVPEENSLADDLEQHIDDILADNPDMNLYIGGHSMGGGICGRYLEEYGSGKIKGVLYVAPFFHYEQPGMKNAKYVKVDYHNFFFGSDHSVIQEYHPNSDDPKLVREYTKIMSRASMVSDFKEFRKNHSLKTLLIIGKDDELFKWKETLQIFSSSNMTPLVLENTGHLDFRFDETVINKLLNWMKTIN